MYTSWFFPTINPIIGRRLLYPWAKATLLCGYALKFLVWFCHLQKAFHIVSGVFAGIIYVIELDVMLTTDLIWTEANAEKLWHSSSFQVQPE